VVDPADTPYQMATVAQPATPTTASLREALAAHLEQRAALWTRNRPWCSSACPRPGSCPVMALAFLQVLTRSASHLAVLAGDPPRHQLAGVRIVALAADDPLRSEWTTIMIGPHYSAMLTAREDAEHGGFTYRLASDRDLVVRHLKAGAGKVLISAPPPRSTAPSPPPAPSHRWRASCGTPNSRWCPATSSATPPRASSTPA
jgi:hypothetical protein